MTNQSLPRVRALVDWDGDGFINRGVRSTDLLNLAKRPLTLHQMVQRDQSWLEDIGTTFPRNTSTTINAKYDPTDRGLFSYTQTIVLNDYITIGWNDASANMYLFDGFTNPAGTYTVQFYIKGNSAYAGVDFTIEILDANRTAHTAPIVDATYITQTAKVIQLTGSYQLVSHTFTFNTASGTHYPGMILRIKHTATASSTNISVTGVSVLAGTITTARAYNVGTAISLRDDIEQYMTGANWQLGMSNPMDNVASEGTATISLKNVNKEFSMESTSSFLYSAAGVGYPYGFPDVKFQEGVLVVIEIMDDITGVWSEIWRGFTTSIDIGTGAASPTAVLNATQGLFRFDKARIDTGVLQGLRADEIIQKLARNGWITAVIPNQAVLNKSRLNEAVTYEVLSDTNTYQLDTGLQTYDFSGENWQAGGTSPVDIIKDLMVAEQGLFFVTRSGKIRFMHRDRIYSTAASEPADTVLTDTLSNSDDYLSQQGTVNSVKLDYFPKSISTGQLWQTKTAIQVAPALRQTTVAKLENYENSKITALTVTAFTATVAPSTYTVTDLSGASLSASYVKITPYLKNGEVSLTIENFYTQDVLVSVTLQGTFLISYGGTSMYRSAINQQAGVGSKLISLSSKLITTEIMARNVADYILAVYAKRLSTFNTITISSRDATWLTRIINLTIGSRIKYKETNTGSVDHRMMVVGEQATWYPGFLSVTYTLRPADNVPYTVLNNTPSAVGGLAY